MTKFSHSTGGPASNGRRHLPEPGSPTRRLDRWSRVDQAQCALSGVGMGGLVFGVWCLNVGGPNRVVGASTINSCSGGDLLSHTLPGAVPSALWVLASGFGMGPGVSPTL